MKDFLWLHLRELPYFRSLVRANEARFYQGLDLPRPVLDIGSGDGHFASVTFDQALDVGIDPWSGPTYKASRTGKYRLLTLGEGGKMPFANASFGSAISNSVLEHIPEVDAVLLEAARVLKPQAPFVFSVPNHQFLPGLSIGNTLDRLSLKSMGNTYRRFFNRISRHVNCDSPATWEERLYRTGFLVEGWWNYVPPAGLHVVEWGHYFGLPSLIIHALTRRWILVSQPWNLSYARSLTEPHYGEKAISPEGVYTFYIARRKA